MFVPHVQSSVIYKSQDMETIHAHQWANEWGDIIYLFIYIYTHNNIFL